MGSSNLLKDACRHRPSVRVSRFPLGLLSVLCYAALLQGLDCERPAQQASATLSTEQIGVPSSLPFPIDVVITWSGENDQGSRAFQSRANRDEGIIKYEVRSLLHFAPWIRTIYLFVNDPKLPSWYQDEWKPKVQVVGRCAYFNNSTDCPTMNSAAVYLTVYKIPELSEQFILMDDDIVLLKPVDPGEFFTSDGKIVSRTPPDTEHESIYDEEAVKRGPIKPPRSPPKFGHGGNDHTMHPNLKTVYTALEEEYREWFAFVRSHKRRWCCCDDNKCHNPIDDCKSCYDELFGDHKIPHIEAYSQKKAIYGGKDLPILAGAAHFEGVSNIEDGLIHPSDDLTLVNINNIDNDDTAFEERPGEYMRELHYTLCLLEQRFPGPSHVLAGRQVTMGGLSFAQEASCAAWRPWFSGRSGVVVARSARFLGRHEGGLCLLLAVAVVVIVAVVISRRSGRAAVPGKVP